MTLILLVSGVALAAYAVIDARGRSPVAWAALLIGLSLLLPRL